MTPSVSQLWPGVSFTAPQKTFLETIICDLKEAKITDDGGPWECQRKEFRMAKALKEKGVLVIQGKQGDDVFNVSLRAVPPFYQSLLRVQAAGSKADGDDTREKVIKWRDMSDDQMRLQCGEMTPQEIRSVRAVLSAICPRE